MPIKTGIIGFGAVTRIMHMPILGTLPAFEIAGIASSQKDAAAKLPSVQVHSDPAALLADQAIDLVIVATPNSTHAEFARAALKAGKHVLVEKPFALSTSEARDVLDLAAATGRIVSAFQNRRFDSDFLSVRSAIESGAIGAVRLFETNYVRHDDRVAPEWRAPARPGAGVWYDLGPHVIDQVLQLFGAPSAISASFGTFRPGADAEDWASAVLHYPDKRVIVQCSFVTPGGVNRFVVHGETGSLVKRRGDGQGAQLMAGMMPGALGWGEDQNPVSHWRTDGSLTGIAALPGDYRRFYTALAAAISGDGPNPTPRATIMSVLAVIEAGIAAAASGHVVPLDLR
jgi:predicted dehydrogenase